MTPAASSKPAQIVCLLREFSIPLLVGVVAALVWANVWPAHYEAFLKTPFIGKLNLTFIVDEIFMAFFFGIAAVEITDSLVPGGSLNPPRKAVAPLIATLGGVVGPVALFFLLNRLIGAPEFARGWGIGTATDIALAWLVARLLFGAHHPAISFLLLLAIVDDAIGLAIIAIFYPDPNHPVWLPGLLFVAGAMVVCYALRKTNVTSYWPYLILGGSISWVGLYLGHLHPAIALVFVVPFMPHQRQPTQETVFDVPEAGADLPHSTLVRFEHEWKVIVDFGMLLFGLANAGVQFAAVGPLTWMVFASLLAGKTIGITGLGLLAQRLGFPLPPGMGRMDLLLVSMIAGIGLTVALFVAGAAFPDPGLQGMAKMGALASALIAPLVFVIRALTRSRKSQAVDATPA